jgi:hypothetical protein
MLIIPLAGSIETFRDSGSAASGRSRFDHKP